MESCGWKVLLLRRLRDEWPLPIIYWGDIDKEGYEIYGKLKGQIPDLKSTRMDRKTIDSHIHASITKPPFSAPSAPPQTCNRNINTSANTVSASNKKNPPSTVLRRESPPALQLTKSHI